ncbi:tetratricopeptide repeat protein [Enterovibrio paralichthyis]|uniref:tetratricopeptide repeat protein n=1 Tax=Enterovibrio paralichthyis TaxID=2853805 RepID=UPI001C43BD2F|nr:GGDEF domain-containing protein [Enterovibrio paralichthyis]MBV7300056.1 GGDEF domain-containing protein [Enterovibrio paralichthyis]
MRFLPASLIALSLSLSPSANARMYSAPALFEAEQLVQTAPEKALEASERYLIQRRLEDTANRAHGNNEVDRSIRTPLNTVHAYLIIAKANSELGNHAAAWEALNFAKALIAENNLELAGLGAKYIEASMLYTLDGRANTAVKLLHSLLEELPDDNQLVPSLARVEFESKLLNACIIENGETEAQSLAQFDEVATLLVKNPDLSWKVRYQIALGKYHLNRKSYERALSELLSAYWLASENEFTIQIGQANLALASLYMHQGALEKAQQHANQAAEFYARFDISRGLSEAQTLLATIYREQGRYNFALANYFNALDIETSLGRPAQMASLYVAIGKIYRELQKYKLADEYVDNAIEIATKHELRRPLTDALILSGDMAIAADKPDTAIQSLSQALDNAEKVQSLNLTLQSLSALSKAYEKKGEFQQALSVQRRYDVLSQQSQTEKQREEAESFLDRQRMIERQLQFDDMQRKQAEDAEKIVEQKKVNLFLIGSLAVLLLILLLRNRTATLRQQELDDLRTELYTHPRSGLRNLRMLNDRLSNSLAKSSAHFEQWYLGEMIHEPLSDKLSFAMFEVPFLKVVYLQHGYHQGLELERQLGDYLKSVIHKPARLYHFSDAMFIYIEAYSETRRGPEKLAARIQSMVDDFVQKSGLEDVDDRLRIGMADYPFLPRAYTSINDKELIDILLMATGAARQACKLEHSSQWVHLSAIDSTPAACFADNHVRQACLDGINTGLIKVKTSAVGGINWQTVHDSDKN